MWLRLITLFNSIKEYVLIMFFAFRHPKTPRYIRRILVLVGIYVISPIDFVPDYLPIVGMVDDALAMPAVLYLLTNLLPPSVRRECELSASRAEKKLPYLFALSVLLAVLWIGFIGLVIYRAFFS